MEGGHGDEGPVSEAEKLVNVVGGTQLWITALHTLYLSHPLKHARPKPHVDAEQRCRAAADLSQRNGNSRGGVGRVEEHNTIV